MNLELLAPIPGDQPAGQDCADDIASEGLGLMLNFLEQRTIQRARERQPLPAGISEADRKALEDQRKEERRQIDVIQANLPQSVMGGAGVEAVARTLCERSEFLVAKRGKDLRLLPFLAAGAVVERGIAGYVDTLTLGCRLYQDFRDSLHPLADEEDNADPWHRRINAVAALLGSGGLRAVVGLSAVMETKRSGTLTLDQLTGRSHEGWPQDETPDARLKTVLGELGPQHAHALLKCLTDGAEAASRLQAEIPAGHRVKVPLAEAMLRAQARVNALVAPNPLPIGGPAPPVAPGMPVSTAATVLRAPHGLIASRADALRQLSELIVALDELAPGHPAPLLLRRAERLLQMGFFEIVNELAPDSLAQFRSVIGTAQASPNADKANSN